MGNVHQQCRGITNNSLELDRVNAIYEPNEIISGTVSSLKHTNASIVLSGIIYFKKRKKTHMEKCRIIFFTSEYNLSFKSNKKEKFQIQLAENLPPSFTTIDTYPNISYSVNLIYKKSKDQIQTSIPIRVYPRICIDRPLLLTPLFFGPVENYDTGIKLEVKLNRAIFTLDDIIQIYYELQNPSQTYIHKTEISLGIYYNIELNVWQEDVCNGIENFNNISSNNKLIRNKALLNIPNKIYLPPTFKFRYGGEKDQSSFDLTIEYKIQFKIYFGTEESLWQVDIPIVLCNNIIEKEEEEEKNNVDEMNIKPELISQSADMNTNICE
ncbi:unnamed protein product [Adineta steineri]|uniref:Arrestin C-terminal-like domain-containing protein n=1 Tax=Adineta steineri TaxID=433720 RepID=A0A819C8C4_9BILA|nr:unnamed protein product [Adineta steineri]CAF3815178.1 unnamed protein product [Adineta steineri]